MIGWKSFFIILSAIIICSTGFSATYEVSRPQQVSSSSYYERGPSIIFDGADYWLFYARSSSVTGNYQNDVPDANDYQVFYKKASSLENIASATPISIPGASAIFHGEISSTIYDGEPWIFGSSVGTLYGWYYNGSSWTQVTIASDLPTTAAYHAVTTYKDSMWVAYTPESLGSKWHTIKSGDPKASSWSFPLMVNNSAANGQADFYIENDSMYLAIYSPEDLYLCAYDSPTITWNTVDQISAPGAGDPEIARAGGQYLFIYSMMSSDSSYRWLEAKASSNLNNILSGGTTVMLDQSSFDYNSWTSMNPVFASDADDSYLFYSSERNQNSPLTELTGNIWVLKLDWTADKAMTDNHYTYIQPAVDAASTGDQIRVAPGTYLNDLISIDKDISLIGPYYNVNPTGSLDRGDEAILVRNDAADISILSGASGAEINGFTVGGSEPGESRSILVDESDITISYNIFINTAGTAVHLSDLADNSTISYNRINNTDSSSIINDGADDVTIALNHITGQENGSAIYNAGRAVINGNTITGSDYGITSTYNGTGEGDRAEILSNSISDMKNPGIRATGTHTYIYNNIVFRCNYYGPIGIGGWDQGSVFIDPDADFSVVEANTVYNGIHGVTIHADSVLVQYNTIYAMGDDYDQETIINNRTYKNSAIVVGTNWATGNYDPNGVVIFNNNLTASNYFAIFHTVNIFHNVDASFNWLGDSLITNTENKIGYRIDYSPWFGSNDDINPGEAGFQGNYNSLWVDDDSPHSSTQLHIAEAMRHITSGGKIHVVAGDYYEDVTIGNYYELEFPGAVATGDSIVVILLGAQANVDPAGSTEDREGGESVIYGRVRFNTDGNGATLNGFKLTSDNVGADKSTVTLHHANHAVVSYNIIMNSPNQGILNGWQVDDCPGTVIKGNVIYSPDQYGIYNYTEDDGSTFGNNELQITGNYILHTHLDGIYLPRNSRDHFISGNRMIDCGFQGVGNYTIRANARSVIDSNYIDSCRNGILVSYDGSGPDDRTEVMNNIINNVYFPGIVVGDFDDSTNSGGHTYLYYNQLSNCNTVAHIGTDNWQYGSIMVFDNAVGTIIDACILSNGVKGITVWADSVSITQCRISGMGSTYPEQGDYSGNTYPNCAIQIGSFETADLMIHDPVGSYIFENYLANNSLELFYPIPTHIINASGNWWGSNDVAVTSTVHSDSVDYSPWISLGSDIDPATPGHQGYLSVLWVDDDSPRSDDTTGCIQEGINMVTGSTVYAVEGVYTEPINIVGKTDLTISGRLLGNTIIRPTETISWDIDSTLNHRRTAIRVYNSYNVVFRKLAFDFDSIKGSDAYGLLYWNSSGEITLNSFDNMNSEDVGEFMTYFSAPDYTSINRRNIDIHQNSFNRTGQCAIEAHTFVNMNIYDNSFDKVDEDFGYGIHLGSGAIGTIKSNEFANYNTWDISENYTVSAILLDNTYTSGFTPFTQTIVIDSNNISDCQYGIVAGNFYAGTTGDVDMNLTITNNNITNNHTSGSFSSGGIIITDEGRDLGSSMTAVIDNNLIDNNGDNGLYVYTDGNGDIDLTVTNNWIVRNIMGFTVKDYGLPSTSTYDLTVHHNIFENNLNAVNDAAPGYWDDGIADGNCWSDYDGGTYQIQGSAGSVDRYPNTDCGECKPGDSNGDGTFNILDITYTIDFLYQDGPDPTPYATCSGDPNGDCTVNILDVTYTIAFLYQEGPDPANSVDWFINCSEPTGAPELEQENSISSATEKVRITKPPLSAI